MKKIVKFKKAHVSGIAKGTVKKIDSTLAVRLEEAGYIQEATEKELNAYNLKESKKKVVSNIDEAKAAANSSNGECEECGDNPECEDCKEKNGIVEEEKTYHILTQEDIDANGDAAEGLSVGDEVEINASDELLTDDEGKLLKKKLGNV